MLIQFNFKNHKSFYEKSTLDLLASSEKRHMQDTIEVNGNRILPYVVIYGPNAAGKTTVIDAFFRMSNLIVASFDSEIREPFSVVPFAFSDKAKENASEFEVFICLNDTEYRYGFSATKKNIIEEWLYKKPFKKGSRSQEKMIFEREKNDVYFSKEFIEFEKYKFLINQKSLLLSFLGRKDFSVFGKIYRWFLETNYISNSISGNYDYRSIKLLYQDNRMKKRFGDFLKLVDPCMEDIEIIAKEDKNQNIGFEVLGKHKHIEKDGEFVSLPIGGESEGTRKILKVIPLILTALDEGGIIFIDELDTRLHPLLLRKIVYMFKDNKINKKNAQLVFTSHNTYLMDSKDTRRDQIYFVEKDNSGKSKLYSLSDFKKVRADSDYEKNYFSGSFGSIPFQDGE